MDFQSFGVDKWLAADVAYAVSVVVVQVDGQCSEHVELLLAQVALVGAAVHLKL